MAEIGITINGRAYDIACDNGQEGRIVDLANYIDQRVMQLARSGGIYNEAHLMVLTALVLADELFEARETAAAAPRTNARGVPPVTATPAPVNKEEEQAVARALESLAKRIEGIAARVQAA
jgi:cell division protein ZapA